MNDTGEHITAVCPVYNEEEHIEKILDFFVKAQPQNKELLIIDGGSNDKTKSIVEKWMSNHSNIKLLHNPKQYVPYALNMGIKNSTGNPIVRIDAHTLYDEDYFIKILETFETTKADIVGGPMRAIGEINFQKAVASCTSTIFGVGNSQFHDQEKEGYVDSVYLGSWQRTIFDDVGIFDTQMKRNQDDEFHYRAKSRGKLIYLNPQIKSWYYPRNTLSKLFSQYFQYGIYKPLVLKKVYSEIKLRHLIPSLFVLYLFLIPLLIIFAGYMALFPLVLYLILNGYFSVKNAQNVSIIIFKFFIYPTLHIAYGLGFIIGIPKRAEKAVAHELEK
jgi:glycosyltransferase involved in cell wall biosynthesis